MLVLQTTHALTNIDSSAVLFPRVGTKKVSISGYVVITEKCVDMYSDTRISNVDDTNPMPPRLHAC